jgi:predicted DNA-binding transcriptional regulator YafY
MRADRLLSIVLLLQSRGRMTAPCLATELEVSVRTVYRDIAALGAAGVPVVTEPGPGGGCWLLDGYRFPLRGLRPDEASALLMLGVPDVIRSLGLDGHLASARRQILVTSGLPEAGALVHLDMPRWFRAREEVPCLRELARATKLGREVLLDSGAAGPLGLVNKAGVWYLVAVTTGRGIRVFRASRIRSVRTLESPVRRPDGFDLAVFWDKWTASFQAGLPSVPVRLRAWPEALAVLPEVFGDTALEGAQPPDADGSRVVTLSFEHELAAAVRLAGFGGLVEVISPASVRELLVRRARGILDRYGHLPADGDAGDGAAGRTPPRTGVAGPQSWVF